MPRTKTIQTKNTRTSLKYKNVWANVEKYCIINNIDRSRLSDILQLSKGTITNRMNSPENLSLGEMLRFCDVVNISIEELFR
jgi:hypothetical protein